MEKKREKKWFKLSEKEAKRDGFLMSARQPFHLLKGSWNASSVCKKGPFLLLFSLLFCLSPLSLKWKAGVLASPFAFAALAGCRRRVLSVGVGVGGGGHAGQQDGGDQSPPESGHRRRRLRPPPQTPLLSSAGFHL
jgi:hypothetical protein